MKESGIKLKLFFLALVFVGVLGIVRQSEAADYYVSPAGGGDCLLGSPCKIEAGLSRLGAGDTLYLLDGTYSETYATNSYVEPAIMNISKYFNFSSPGTADAPITIKAYPGATPILEGDGTTAGIRIDGENYLVIEGLTLRNFWEAGVRIGYDVLTTNIVIRNNDFSNIRCNDNMGGVYVGKGENILIENNKFHDNYYERSGTINRGLGLIAFRGKNITIKNNDFYNLNQGIYYKHGEAISGEGGYTRILNNHFYDVGPSWGIGSNQNRTEITNNLLENCPITLHNEDGTQADFTHNVKIEHNSLIGGLIYLSGGSAFSGATGTSIKNNLVYGFSNNEHRGITVWPYEAVDDSQTTISNNLVFSSSFPTGVIRVIGQAFDVDNLPGSILGRQGNLTAQPVFVDQANYDYTLAANSPGKNAASDGTDMGADISLVGVQNETQSDIIPPSAPQGLSVN